jgi:hypothetical protein
LIKHSFLLYFPRELLMNFLMYNINVITKWFIIYSDSLVLYF